MLIKKRWAWLTSVVLLGFLARADGHRKDDSSSIVEAPIVDHAKRDILQEPTHKTTDECVKTEDVSIVTIPIEAKSTMMMMDEVEPERDLKALSSGGMPVKSQVFPYAIDSPPSIANVSTMLSFCVYHDALSIKECNEFWEQSCDKDSFHQYQFKKMNVMTVCKNDDRVYVAFAGTQSWSDIAVDGSALSCEMHPSKKGVYAHSGFVARAKEYGDWMNEKLLSIQDIDQKEIILTGHSLGAALATILSHEAYEGLNLRARGGVTNALNQVKVIGFGSPSALLDPNAYFLGHLNHIRFYNPHDPVATTFASASGYGHVGVELVIPDGPARHISRAAPLLNKHMSLRLLRNLPISYWNSLPPIPRSRLDLGFDVHYMYPYAILAEPMFIESQRQRKKDQSLTSLVNAERTISKRLGGAPVVCRSENGKVICSSKGKIVAKFRYALDAHSTEHQVDVCMSSIVSTNFVPGVTVNAGISVGGNMSPGITASEALILDISDEDKWYEGMPSSTLASLYLDGNSSLPKACNREPTFLESSKTLPSERALIRKFIEAPGSFNVTRNHLVPPNETVDLVQADPAFFDDSTQSGWWMDCRLPENSSFCPASCKGNQACAMIKFWSTDADGANYWVSLSKSPGMKWSEDGNSWKYTVVEKRTSWFSIWRSQSQATFMVVRNEPEGQSQLSN